MTGPEIRGLQARNNLSFWGCQVYFCSNFGYHDSVVTIVLDKGRRWSDGPSLRKEFVNMSLEQRLEALKVRHSTLEDLIHQESSRPLPDDVEIHALKKEKLRIKDEMAGIATRH
jgi:hypothetical protein